MAPESSWRYMIVAACGGALFFGPSSIFSHGVMYVAYTETGLYHADTVAWLLSFTNSMHATGVFLGGILVKVSSCRTTCFMAGATGFLGYAVSSCVTNIGVLFLTYGVITGLSRGVILSAAIVSVSCWYKADSSVASGVMYGGVGLAMFVSPRLFQAFLDIYDVDDAMLLTGAITLHGCICALLIRPSNYELEQKELIKKRQRTSDPVMVKMGKAMANCKDSILTNWSFMLFVLGVSCFMMSFQIIMTFMPAYFRHFDATPQESAMAASLAGIGGLVSRVLAGMTANDPKIGPVLLFEGNCGIAAILTFLLPYLAGSVTGRYLYAAAIGTYLSCLFVILGPVTYEKIGLDNLPYAFGFIYFSNAIVYLLGPPLAGCLLLGACVSGLLSEMVKKPTVVEDKADEECEIQITLENDKSSIELENEIKIEDN